MKRTDGQKPEERETRKRFQEYNRKKELEGIMTIEDLASKVGKSPAWVRDQIQFQKVEPELRFFTKVLIVGTCLLHFILGFAWGRWGHLLTQ